MFSDDMPWSCCSCGIKSGKGVTLVAIHSIGMFYMCTDCINKEAEEKKKGGLIAVFSYQKGLMYMTQEQIDDLKQKGLLNEHPEE